MAVLFEPLLLQEYDQWPQLNRFFQIFGKSAAVGNCFVVTFPRLVVGEL